ncbi:TetR/AcrR family transcriptional regulator [Shewanella fidelis]|uniref:TetR/AcrR family transcriptional regulator n=1 Tax=Shewanella fidelis TaxID=173509 RepID=A0AAW8NUQ6_9GAMM|nr:TetR/AcrR family transcriptional regulator [Shewanella fidelis]MDR8525956.1 TetR/AcrR family transcriptional regulator [Shewanella fidelis]MDW4813856.1 TetR/AcrR family transcriptional regulator [Shewanella fidelis]MDW4817952.1 TetR/AcrR family transcriptional regulator [Shewanella fidelis]MDW4822019.1 TetR/AcrR family transcriptional regulator [Shewanella fidelis]MDW4826184.1 TetR/AcrR family transcriptional regulator [Shewanella fidelis]
MKTRDKIVQASLELFNEHGERAITTNHIAAHLNISPGNLYYHFRNKEDIIRSIFGQYEQHLESGFQPYADKEVDIDLLIGYFDAMFYTLWQFRFMYANLADILSRDETLKKRYLTAQQDVLARCTSVLEKLNQDGFVAIEPDDIKPLADTIKMLVSFWISYKLTQTQSNIGSITKESLYEGLLRVIMLFKSYATADSQATFLRLESYYIALAKGETE